MSKELPPSRRADQFVARFPDGLRGQLSDVAKQNGRSMNAEIVVRLQASLEPQPTERIEDLELQLAQHRTETSIERSKANQYGIALVLIASRVSPETFADKPMVAEILKKAGESSNTTILESIRQTLADAQAAVAIVDAIKPK